MKGDFGGLTGDSRMDFCGRELGFLRKRRYSSSGCTLGQKGSTVQHFRYLIVIDFESTCWQDTKFKAQEIIEFPAVLLNTQTGEVESEFHFYTQPQEHPVLSSFCTELTGITQGQVDDGIPINLCLRKFTYWLDKLYREKSVVCEGTKTEIETPINCTCVTWSDWDLGVCLMYECKRKQLLKPAQLNSWIDLRATYRKFYDRKPNGLNGALQDLGIEFQGREHSGVDDARNTAKLAYRMIKDGCVLKTTKTLKTHERSSSCIAQYRVGSNQTGSAAGVKPQQMDIRAFTGGRQTPVATKKTPQKATKISEKGTPKTPKQQPRTPKQAQKTSKQTPRTPKQTPRTPKQSPRTPKQTPRTPKQTHRTPKQTRTTPKIIPTTPKQTQTYSKQTPKKVKLTPIKASITDKNTVKPKTPTKTTQGVNKTQKRKLNTPVKTVIDTGSCSPRRKVPRTFSPKKLSVDDVYRDGEKISSNYSMNNHVKPGLQVCDMNVLANQDHLSGTLSTKHTQKQNNTNSTSSKSPKSKLNCFKPQSFGTFKKPLPVGKSPSPRSVQKAVCTSTPVNGNTCKAAMIQGTGPSPIQPSSTGSSHGRRDSSSSSGFISSYSMEKTPSGTSQRTRYSSSSSLSSFATPSVPSFMKTGSYSSFGSTGGSETKMKVTPPLCNCGRRSKRRMVQNPGQNMGRFFFTCAIRHSVASKTGCDFFKWESSLGFSREKNVSKQYTPVMGSRSASVARSGAQKRSLGVRGGNSQRVFIR